MCCGVYKITNIVNHKVYIGSSTNINKRTIQHKSNLLHNRHHNTHLQRAWDKYGKTRFIFETILYCDKKMLSFYEQRSIDVYMSFDGKFGYNVCPAKRVDIMGDNAVERSRKISEANSGKNNPMAKSITVSGVRYGTIADAAQVFGLSTSALKYRLKNDIDLNKSTSNSGKNNPGAKSIIVDGKYYDTITDAAQALGINYGTLTSRLEKNTVLSRPVLEDISGSNNPMAKPITIDGKQYNTVKEVTLTFGINYQTLIYRLKHGVDLNKKVSNEGEFNKAAKPVIIDGVYYPTVRAAAKILLVDPTTIRYRVKTKKPGYFWASNKDNQQTS